MVARLHFLIALVASLFVFAGTAYATPVFLSAINISEAGRDAFDPQVKVDGSGNVHAVWTRSDGTNFRIQYSTRTPTGDWSVPLNISDSGQSADGPQLALDSSGNVLAVWSRSDGTNLRIQAAFKPAGGSFAAPVTVSAVGQDAFAPQVDFDGSGRALLVWSRFDGANTRVQASIRNAGSGGAFLAPVTLSAPGQDAVEPVPAAGPTLDENGVVVWYRSDGTNLRIQSSRRRDVSGYVRPQAAGPLRVSLAVAYNECISSNALHAPPLAHPSCKPPVRTSSVLTVGTPDANTFAANAAGSVRFNVFAGTASTEANEADVFALVKMTDVRQHPSGADYTGQVGVRTNLQITDNQNSPEQPAPGTTQRLPLEFPVQCVATGSTSIGGRCDVTTSINALMPGAVVELKRSIWDMGQITVRDAGPNGTGYAGCPPTCGDGDETTFMRQGIFIP